MFWLAMSLKQVVVLSELWSLLKAAANGATKAVWLEAVSDRYLMVFYEAFWQVVSGIIFQAFDCITCITMVQ